MTISLTKKTGDVWTFDHEDMKLIEEVEVGTEEWPGSRVHTSYEIVTVCETPPDIMTMVHAQHAKDVQNQGIAGQNRFMRRRKR